MGARVIISPLPSEQIVAVDPQLQQQVTGVWQRRLRMFTGRTLTAPGLSAEQDYRSGHMGRTGQMLTHGAVTGLDLSLDLSGSAPIVVLGAGQGLAFSGEDVTVPSSLRIPLAGISVYTGSAPESAATGPQTVASQNFGAWTKAGTVTPPSAGVLVLQPITIQIAGNTASGDTIDITAQLLSSPDRDPDEYAFEDWQTMDGCRLVFFPWPTATIALPAQGALFRNQLAHAIFALEAGFGRNDSFPWDAAGVPLGLVAFDNAWKPLFVDCGAVVRQGGLPRQAFDAPFEKAWQAPDPCLAQAVLRQFMEQNAALPAAAPPAALSGNFQYLPPVGILAANAINWTAASPTNSVFPSNYTVTAQPVFADELDVYLQQSAELAPFDLTVADNVQVLVPVPEADYDPALLQTEAVAAEFNADMATATTNRVLALQRRSDLEAKANVFLTLMATPPIVDTDIATDEQKDLSGAAPYQAPADEAFGTTLPAGATALVSTDIVNLKAAATALTTGGSAPARLITDTDLAIIDNSGLQAFINTIQGRIAQANDTLDLGFLRAQTDVYRYRQIMLDNSDATRLATSPVLAQIAQGTDAGATADQIDQYFSQSVSIPQTAAGQSYMTMVPTNLTVAVPPPATSVTNAASSAVYQVTTYKSQAVTNATQVYKPPASSTQIVDKAAATRARTLAFTNLRPSAPLRSPALSNVRPGVKSNVTNFAEAVTGTATRLPFTGATYNPPPAAPPNTPPAAAPPSAPATPPPPTPASVQQQSPLTGAQYSFRTVSIAERLKQSPSQEAVFFTGQNRGDVTQAILNTGLYVDDLNVNYGSGTGTSAALGAIRSGATAISNLQSVSLSGDSDEASILSAGIQALEQHIALMRQMEGRVAQYTQLIAECQQTLGTLQSNLGAIDSALAGAENILSDARHAYIFTAALLADETARVAAVNAQRKAILAQDVPFLMFCRPLTLSATIAEASRELVPQPSATTVPACLNRSAPAPPEIRQMVSLLRNAPAYWLPSVLNTLNGFERPDLLSSLASRMVLAAQPAAQNPQSAAITVDQSAYADKINLAYTTQAANLDLYRRQRAAFPAVSLQSQPWSTQISALQPFIGVGDLLASDAGNLITRNIGRQIDQITAVAACVYDRAGDVLPAIRLAWADAFYQAQDSADMHDLSVLPQWGQVPVVQRQEMQQLVSWLFTQIDASVPAAVEFMSDVVRVALLLASHAPVSEIIMGSSLEAAPLKPGGSLRVSLPSLRIYQAMPVALYYNTELAAHGTVADLSDTEASIQITSVVAAQYSNLPSGSSVQYVAQRDWTNVVTGGALTASSS